MPTSSTRQSKPRHRRRPPTPRYPKATPTHTPPQCQPDNHQAPKRPTLVKPTYFRVAFAGKICSGKTTLAKHVIDVAKRNRLMVQRVAFGDFVKEMATRYFDYDRTKYKNRELLVKLGTSMRTIQPDVWVNCLKKHILNSDAQHWVVDDVRHENEVHALHQLGFTILRIDIPEEVRIARVKKTYPDTYEEHLRTQNHSTETELFGDDAVVDQVVDHTDAEHVVDELVTTFTTTTTSQPTYTGIPSASGRPDRRADTSTGKTMQPSHQ